MKRLEKSPTFTRFRVKTPKQRHATVGEILDFSSDMVLFVMLSDAYWNEKRITSLSQLSEVTEFKDLSDAKKEVSLTEGSKILQPHLVRVLLDMLSKDTLIVSNDDCAETQFWEVECLPFMEGDIIKQLDHQTGSFNVWPVEEQWLIHTRDDEPWVYILVDRKAECLVKESCPNTVAMIDAAFPYC